MPFIEILPDTDPIMRKTSRRVTHVDDDLRQLVADMYDIMVARWGIGLAAVQVGVLKRFFIYEIPKREIKGYETCHKSQSEDDTDAEDVRIIVEVDVESSSDESDPEDPDGEDAEKEIIIDPGYTGEYVICINPRIISREGEIIDDEGCLSKEGWVAKVKRAIVVTFQAFDLDMTKFEMTVKGMEARCVQHEIDHLDGILFTDRAEPDTLKEITEEEEPVESEDGSESVENEDEQVETSVSESA